jgi:hypothetical protein
LTPLVQGVYSRAAVPVNRVDHVTFHSFSGAACPAHRAAACRPEGAPSCRTGFLEASALVLDGAAPGLKNVLDD